MQIFKKLGFLFGQVIRHPLIANDPLAKACRVALELRKQTAELILKLQSR